MKKILTSAAALALLGVPGDRANVPQGTVPPPDTTHTRRFSDGQFTRIRLTKEGDEVIKRLAAQGDALMKTPTPTGGSASKENIAWLSAIVKDIPGASVKEIDEKGYHQALTIKREGKADDVWYIKSIGPTDFLFWGFGGGWGFTLVNKEDPQTIAIHEGNKLLTKNGLLAVLDDARQRGISQKTDPAGAKQFDLTRKRPIGYLCFNGFDEGDKPSRKQYYEYSNALPELLTRCGYDMVCLDNQNRITELQGTPTEAAMAGLVGSPGLGGVATFAATPYETNAKLVERHVDALYKQGVRDFYLNFLTHGDRKQGMLGYDGKWLKGDDVKKIVEKYSNCRFAIDATGCEGGSLIAMMRDFRDAPDAPEGRVVVFTHTREDLSTLSHDYQSLLVKRLADMADGAQGAPQTYGEAHYDADLHRRRLTNGRHDPEFWKSMPGQPSIRTAFNDMPDRGTRAL